jgi:mercuric ion transport protein
MSGKRDGAALVGVGAAACAVCCAGPILGFLAAIGLGTAAGAAVFGVSALVVGAAIAAFVVVHRRRRAASCAPVGVEPAPLDLTERARR